MRLLLRFKIYQNFIFVFHEIISLIFLEFGLVKISVTDFHSIRKFTLIQSNIQSQSNIYLNECHRWIVNNLISKDLLLLRCYQSFNECAVSFISTKSNGIYLDQLPSSDLIDFLIILYNLGETHSIGIITHFRHASNCLTYSKRRKASSYIRNGWLSAVIIYTIYLDVCMHIH